jgi:hypothetical protein
MILIKLITVAIIFFIIFYYLNKKKQKLTNRKTKLVKLNNADRILNDKNILNIVYSIEGYYYYNQQAFAELISYLESFLEIIELIKIDDHYSTNLYANLRDLKKLIINALVSIEIKLPTEYNINDVVNDIQEVLDTYIDEVYLIHENYVKRKGMDYTVKIIKRNDLDGYNADNSIFEPNKKLLFNRI